VGIVVFRYRRDLPASYDLIDLNCEQGERGKMREHLAVAGLLLAFVCPIPIPWQTSNHRGQPSNNPKQQTPNSNTPAKPTITLIEKDCESEQFKNDADCKHTENKEQAVAVSKLPTTNVSVQRSDPYDWLAYWTGIVLTVVGIAGIFVGWRTLGWLRVQTIATQDAAKAAQDGTALALAQIKMMKDKERARIAVTFVGPESLQFGTDEGNRIELRVENVGATLAQNVVGFGEVKVIIQNFDTEGFINIGQQDLVLPDVMRANFPASETYLAFDMAERWGEELTLVDRQPVLITIRGVISYSDIFEDRHTTTLNYDMRIPRILKWRNSSVAEVHPFSHWSKLQGSEDT
jgi:hypothetical protein